MRILLNRETSESVNFEIMLVDREAAASIEKGVLLACNGL